MWQCAYVKSENDTDTCCTVGLYGISKQIGTIFDVCLMYTDKD